MTAAICDTFRQCARTVFVTYQAGRSVNIVPWETTFTDQVLLEIATAHPSKVLVERFTGQKEALTGADWEWWFRSSLGIEGLRIQAKRRNPNGRSYGTTKRVAGRYQADLLVTRSAKRGTTPFYALYGDRAAPGPRPGATPGPCPHGPFDPRLWGVSLVPASLVMAHLSLGHVRPRLDLLNFAAPWHHLVCRSTNLALDDRRVDATVRSFIDDRYVEVERVLRRMDDSQMRAHFDDLWFSDVTRPVPDDVAAAFEQRDARLVRPTAGVAGVVLVDSIVIAGQEIADLMQRP